MQHNPTGKMFGGLIKKIESESGVSKTKSQTPASVSQPVPSSQYSRDSRPLSNKDSNGATTARFNKSPSDDPSAATEPSLGRPVTVSTLQSPGGVLPRSPARNDPSATHPTTTANSNSTSVPSSVTGFAASVERNQLLTRLEILTAQKLTLHEQLDAVCYGYVSNLYYKVLFM